MVIIGGNLDFLIQGQFSHSRIILNSYLEIFISLSIVAWGQDLNCGNMPNQVVLMCYFSDLFFFVLHIIIIQKIALFLHHGFA